MWLGHIDRLLECGPAHLAPALTVALQFVRQADWGKLADGRHDLDRGVYLLLSRVEGRGKEGARLEAHDKYLDVQLALEGTDLIGWRERRTCKKPAPVDPKAGDICFFDDAPSEWVGISGPQAAALLPGDAHAPLGGTGMLRKAVFKIPMG